MLYFKNVGSPSIARASGAPHGKLMLPGDHDPVLTQLLVFGCEASCSDDHGKRNNLRQVDKSIAGGRKKRRKSSGNQ